MFRMLFWVTVTLFGGFYLFNNFIYAQSSSYQNYSPKLTLSKYFNEKVEGIGFVQDITGHNYSSVSVVTKGKWKRNDGYLYRHVNLNQFGNVKQKIQINFEDTNKFLFKVNGSVKSYEGTQYGNVAHFEYDYTISYKSLHFTAQINEWLHYLGEGKLVSKIQISKFGIPFATSTVVFSKN
ncbi:MAG: DUF3833 family protein [Rickettsiales bacterium]